MNFQTLSKRWQFWAVVGVAAVALVFAAMSFSRLTTGSQPTPTNALADSSAAESTATTVILTPTLPPAENGTPTGTAVIVAAANAPVIATGTLNMRQGPGTIYPVMALVVAGTNLTVLGQTEAGNWLLVQLPDGTEGWVARSFTTYTNITTVVAAPPVPLATATLIPAPIPITDWRGEYWPNRDLEGVPTIIRNDVDVNFNWAAASPDASLPADNFSARWSRNIDFEQGTYLFHIAVDDGARLWVDGQLLIDTWQDGSYREVTADLAMAAGPHNIAVAYYDSTGDARVRMWWGRINNPQYPDWKAEYWTNRNLEGSPALVRNDTAVNFDWGTDPPAIDLPVDNFSVRWSRWADFQSGSYRFWAQADDGIRVRVGDNMIINQWQDSDGQQTHTAELNLSGAQQVVVEYYDRDGKALAKANWEKVSDLATSTPTPTATETATLEVTPAETATGEATPTETATAEATPTETTTVEATPTETATAEATATVEAAPTETATAEATPTETATAEAAQPPSAAISAPETAQVNQEVTFDGSTSQPGSSLITAYDWDFGDNTTGSGANIGHTFSVADTYTVTLTVTDEANLTSSTTFQIVIQ